jgi:RNA-directed DNA polymerase
LGAVSELLSQLSRVALLPADELMTLIRSAPHRYKVYQIPKRKPGQFRTIAQPAKEVKALQYWVMKNVLNKFEVHPAATGYRKGRSIAHNARPHTRSRFLLKLDFKDFFPSLKARDFRQFLKQSEVDFDKETVEALCRILFWRPKGTKDLCLSIGAPTSPLLSNILMLGFDRRVSAFCADHGVAYTRYADDLTFSAKNSESLAQVEEMVHGLCRRMRRPSLTIKEEKTVRVSKRDSRRVTGLVLTNDRKVSLGRDLKRRIRAWVHHFVTDRLSEEDALRLRGMLNHVNSVEPAFIQRLIEKYGAGTIRRIQTGH